MNGNKRKKETINRLFELMQESRGIKIDRCIVCSIFISLLSFVLIYGFTPLNVTNDKWIMAGYDETDIICHYLGWVGFRNSDWSFPLGLAHNIGYPAGTIISFTDSLPWVSIVFKVIRHILPETFQFFGIYTLLCFVLQGMAGYKIMLYLTKDERYSLLCSVFFLFAPIFLERSFRHAGLGAQWLVLFSFLIYLYQRDKYSWKYYIAYLLLLILAIGIHPYFLPMIAVFLLLGVIADVSRKKSIAIIFLTIDLCITYGVGWCLGVLGSGVSPSRWGYGYYSMNLNAPINPTSYGGYTWSSFVKVYPQILGNYDGFNYLGLGIISSTFLLVAITLFRNEWSSIIALVKKEYLFLIAMMCCTIFAISNVVTFNEKTLVQIPLPENIRGICEIFRASGRLFYPVYYSIFVGVLLAIWKYKDILSERVVLATVVIILAVQIFDIHNCIIEKHVRMKQNATYQSLVDDLGLRDIASNNQTVVLDGYSGDFEDIRRLGVWAGNNNLKMYFTAAISGDYEGTYAEGASIIENIKNGYDIGENIIVSSDRSIVEQYLTTQNIGYYEVEETYYLANINSSVYLKKSLME